MQKIYILFILLLTIMGCEVYSPIEKIDLIANNLKKLPSRNFEGCLIRYNLIGYYSRLSESVQKRAIDNAFSMWQKANPNMLYINYSDTTLTEIIIKFVSPSLLKTDSEVADFGIMETTMQPLTQLNQIKGIRYQILLDNSYNWDENSITKAVGYQIGSYLGFPSSSNPSSIMYSITSLADPVLSREDSLLYNQLYPLPCKDMDMSFLPLSLRLSSSLTGDVKLEKPGTIFIHSSGTITVGTFIGDCTPDGKFEFTYLGLPFDVDTYTYNIEPTFPHGAVMYKINNEQKWRLCKSSCEFSTVGNEYITLTLQINDKDFSDNIGAFNVEINYK